MERCSSARRIPSLPCAASIRDRDRDDPVPIDAREGDQLEQRLIRVPEVDACEPLIVVLPTDMPHVTAELLRALAEAAEGAEAAVPHSGPLPGAYCRSALPLLEQRIASGDLALYRACIELEPRTLQWDEGALVNVNTPADLQS